MTHCSLCDRTAHYPTDAPRYCGMHAIHANLLSLQAVQRCDVCGDVVTDSVCELCEAEYDAAGKRKPFVREDKK